MIRDVTDIAKKEIELLQSETRFRSLVEKSHEAVSLCNKHGVITAIFGSVHLDMGYSTEDLIGKNPISLSHPDDEARLAYEIQSLSNKPGASVSMVYRMRRKDGTHCWILSNITNLLEDAHVESMVFNFIDVSALKSAEEHLVIAKNEALAIAKEYKTILDSQSVYVIKTDLEANYTYVNNYFLSRFGKGEDMIGKNSMDSIMVDDHSLCIATVEKCLLEPGKTFDVVLRKPFDESGIRGSKWEFKAVTDIHGVPKEILCVGFDITNELKSLENTQRLLAITQSQNQRLIEYTHITSHNLRSPVARILGLCTLIEAEPENLEYRDLLKVSAYTLDDTIRWMNKLLDIENEEKAAERQPIDLNKLIQYNLELFHEDLKQVTVINELPTEYFIPGYSLYLDSVFNNLLSNALKYKNQTFHLY